ncbi:MAG: aspartyl protease family protein [Limisphaerales bacterium]
MKILFIIILTCFCFRTVQAIDERIFIDAKINNKPVRFAFDTGTGASFVLFSTSAKKLGLKFTPPASDYQPKNGKMTVGWTELCNLEIAYTNFATRIAVFEKPDYLKEKVDGMLGWPAIRDNTISVDFINHTFIFYTNIPEACFSWVKLQISTNSNTLSFEVSESSGKKNVLSVDSGASGGSGGISLNPQRWYEWKLSNKNQPVTLNAYYTPNPGLVVAEQGWADKISFGSLTLTDIPVMESNLAQVALHSLSQTEYEATLGFAALKRLEIIIDGRHGVAYLKPKNTAPLPFDHNRLGAVFVPQNLEGNDLIAHVADSSPASEAGILNDDILQKIDELDATQWRTDPNVLPMSRFWNRPAGTKVELTLKRGDKVFKTTAILRNILPPDVVKNSK